MPFAGAHGRKDAYSRVRKSKGSVNQRSTGILKRSMGERTPTGVREYNTPLI